MTADQVEAPAPAPSTAKLAEALAAFQAEVPTVHKGKTANVPMKSGGSYSYTYADLADITAAAFPVLSKHGLAFTALPRRTGDGFELVGRLLHKSGESVEGVLPLTGRSAQEFGSSLTYMRRYLFGCMTGIVTDDDDDGARASKSVAVDDVDAAQELWSAARRAKDLEAVRALWNEADRRGLLGYGVTDPADSSGELVELGARLRQLGDSLQTFDPPPDAAPPPAESKNTPPPASPRKPNRAQHRMLNGVLGKLRPELTKDDHRDERLSTLGTLIGRDITSSNDITADEMSTLLDRLSNLQDGDQLDAAIAEALS